MESRPSDPRGDAIGDQNVDRLLSSAYQPEEVDPEFVQRLTARAQDEARRGPAAQRASTTGWSRAAWAAAASAAAVLLTVAVLRLTQPSPQALYYRDGELVWIDGEPYVAADSAASGSTERRPVLRPATERPRGRRESPVGRHGLAPRQRQAPPEAERAAVGDSIVTGRGQRRRLQLPDGSQLMVNEEAQLTISGERRIAIDAGEVFVEVSPVGEPHDGATFVVDTPARDVEAWGTKFAVRVSEAGTGVMVTQGKVKVAGVEPMIVAGQQLHPQDSDKGDAARVSPLPRASHALSWTRDLMTAAESPLVPASEHGGGALVAVDPQGQQMKLSLRKYHVDVHIEDGFARTTIDQTYFNHRSQRLEGTFYFPLPPDASISRLAMYVNGRLMEGGMAERDHARDVFETIKYRSLDPALLEWVDGSTFKMRVFPLEGRQEKRIVLSYTQQLDDSYGRVEYRFPAGHNMQQVGQWSTRVHVADGEAVEWACSSHELQATVADDGLTLTGQAVDAELDRDRDLVVQLTASDAGQQHSARAASEQWSFSTAEHEGARYLMLRLRPELPAAERRPRRDWVFLLEADGSRDPLLARVQADIVLHLLENAGHDDTFSIITAGARTRAFAPQPTPVTSPNIAAAAEFLDATHLVGALDLGQALQTAGRFAEAGQDSVLVHIGAGVPILGERQIDKLLDRLPQAPYVGVGVGRRWNRQLMKAAAQRTGGLFAQINPDEPTAWRTMELLSTLNAPRLLGVSVTAEPDQEFLLVKDWAAHGERLCAVARLDKDAPMMESVTVSGTVDGEPYRRTIPLEQYASQDAGYLPRIWAKLAIDQMVAEDAQANKAEIVELSKSMYVMSPFTSLLVLENDEMYEQYNVDRGRRDHWALYPCPPRIEVVHEPLVGPQRAETGTAAKSTPARPSPDEVLKTIFVRTGDHSYTSLAAVLRASRIRSVPNGGMMLLGGIRLGESPLLNTTPYVDRLHRGESIRDVERLMMMVTPRIIIQDEEEERLGVAAQADFDDLIKLIETTVAPDVWDEVGGPGVIEPFPNSLSLVVEQTQRVHQEWLRGFTRVYPVSDLVMEIGPSVTFGLDQNGNPTADLDFQFRQDSFGSSTPQFGGFDPQTAGRFGFVKIPPVSLFFGEPPITHPNVRTWQDLTRRRAQLSSMVQMGQLGAPEQRILDQLGKPATLKYESRALQQVLGDISSRYDIPIVIHRTSLQDQGIETDAAVTIDVNDISLRSALTLILDEVGLTYFVADEVLQIVADPDTERYASHASGLREPLLLVTHAPPSSSERRWPARDGANLKDSRLIDWWAVMLLHRLSQSAETPHLLYPDLRASSNLRSFRHLASFAPGINTSRSDALAALESEAELPERSKTGEVDQRARRLIDGARSRGWQLVTWRDRNGRVELRITVDGQGRFRIDRQTVHGLGETVVNDGTALRHLYPELGLGTTRTMSRFHRTDVIRLVPWLLPPIDDLATGADLRMVGPNTVAVVPHAVEQSRDEQAGPKPHVRQHLVFGDDGRLVERRLVALPSGKTLARAAYGSEGKVQWFDDQDRRQVVFEITAEPSSPPQLNLDVDQLVLLPMPVRDADYVRRSVSDRTATQAAMAQNEALKRIASEQNQVRPDDPATWSEQDALQLLASSHWQDADELRDVIGRRFFARGDRRLGFYTLLLSSGARWPVDRPVELAGRTTTLMNPAADHPESPLAHFIAAQLEKPAAGQQDDGEVGRNRFVAQLREYQQLSRIWRWQQLPADAEARRQLLDRTFEFVRNCDSIQFACVILRRVQRQLADEMPHGRIAECLIELEKKGVTSYIVKYELARSLASSGQAEPARQLFVQLYRETLEAGLLPPIDQAFYDAVKDAADDAAGRGAFAALAENACSQLIERRRRPLAIALAWQCRQLGRPQLAERLVDQALAALPEGERAVTTLAAVEHWLDAEDLERAGALLRGLLSDEPYSQSPQLWRLAGAVAERDERWGEATVCLERAMDIEFERLPTTYNVEGIRASYGQLFDRYEKLVRLLAQPGEAPPLELTARIVQAADRWRLLDTDSAAACQRAARLLDALGGAPLAWDYLTTPLASKPNEAAGWLELAETLRDDGRWSLADRAYAAAFEAESTNPDILWRRAQLLEQAGRQQQAEDLYRRIADGTWQPRFRRIQQQAQRLIDARRAAAP